MITEDSLTFLRGELERHISGKRLSHTFGVELETRSLASVFAFSEGDSAELAAAALLHDITKQRTPQEHLDLCAQFCIETTEVEARSPKLYHALTGAALASSLYPDICCGRMIRALMRHTLGSPEMTVFEALLYLADYIEPTRDFIDCIKIREFFYNGIAKVGTLSREQAVSVDTRVVDIDTDNAVYLHLIKTLVLSYDMTIRNLCDEGRPIHPTTVNARNTLLSLLPKNSQE